MAIVSSPTLAGVWEPPFPPAALEASVELYWLPLGAGGWFVRLNGRIYEAIHAFLERRRPLDLYHSALQVRLPEGRFVIENSWPVPDAEPAARGGGRPRPRWEPPAGALARVPLRGPSLAGRHHCGRRGGGGKSAAPERRPTGGASPPRPRWRAAQPGVGPRRARNGRDVELELGYFMAARPRGLPTDTICPPAGGRAPGWAAGLVTALREPSDERAGQSSGAAPRPSMDGGTSHSQMRCQSSSWTSPGRHGQVSAPNRITEGSGREAGRCRGQPTDRRELLPACTGLGLREKIWTWRSPQRRRPVVISSCAA
jgi:hypothetical protein